MASRRGGNALDLWMNGQRVGTWTQNGDRQALSYAAEWSDAPEGRPLSLSLPLLPAGASHQGAAVAAWFENLLPDSILIRRRIRERVAARSTAAFDLLAEIGRDCAGAVQFVPSGGSPGEVHGIDAVPLDEAGVARELRAVTAPATPGRRDEATFRISLAGAQEKTALLWHGGRWCRPNGSTPTTHLFKLPIGRVGNMQADFATSVENEWLCSEIVRAFGLQIARTQIASFEDQKVLIVERFDRRLSPDASWWMRLPQEDMCQANGLPPDARYEADGGPGVFALMTLLANSDCAEQDRACFFRAQLIFWLLAATDGHAKNFSVFIGPRGSFRMTPLYDVLSVYPVLGRGRNQLDRRQAKVAMAVTGRNRHYALAEILPRHWLEMARRCGIDGEAIIHELLGRLPHVLATAATLLPTGFAENVSTPILQGLERAGGRLAAGM